MNRLRLTAAILTLLLLVCTGCSVRPQNGTTILADEPSSLASQNVFDLKNVTFQKSQNKNLLGWQGNDLMLYDSKGIYLLNYKTAELSTLLSPEGKASIQYAVLSNNGKNIFYTVLNENKEFANFISSADCKSDIQRLSSKAAESLTLAKSIYWSSGGGFVYAKHSASSRLLEIYNVADTSSTVLKMETAIATIYDVDDKSKKLLVSQYTNSIRSPTLCIKGFDGSSQVIDSHSFAMNAAFVGSNHVAYQSGSSFCVVDTTRPDAVQTYNDIASYALSADRNYISLAKSDTNGYSDIYVGELRGGDIANLSLLYKGYNSPVSGMYFSPDNKRIVISDYPIVKAADSQMLVLTF